MFPVDVAKKAIYEKSKWGKAFLKFIDDVDQYKGNWALIKEFLGKAEVERGLKQ